MHEDEVNLLDLVMPATTTDTNIHTFSQFKQWVNNSFQIKTQLNSASYINKKDMVRSLKLRTTRSIGAQSPKMLGSLKSRPSFPLQTLDQIQQDQQAFQHSWMEASAKSVKRSRKNSYGGGQLGFQLREHSVIKSHSAQSSRSFNGFEQINQYELKQLLGKGSFADVYLGFDTSSEGNQKYAIKVLQSKHIKKKLLLKKNSQLIESPPPSLQQNDEKPQEKESLASMFVRNEVAILKKMEHQYITKLHEVIVDNEKSRVYLVLEYCSGGFINESKSNKGQYRKLLESECRRYCKQIAVALNFIHNVAKIAHRDIKPENILLNQHDEVKISDFGLGTHKLKGKKVSGTPLYMPPESQFSQENTSNQPGDIWALGVTLLVLLTGKHPEFYDHKIDAQKAIASLKDVSQNCRSFINCCLEVDASKRIKAEQLLAHNWLGISEQVQQLRATNLSYEINVTPADEANVFKAKANLIKEDATSFKITFD